MSRPADDPAAVLRREVVLVFAVDIRGTWPPAGFEGGPVLLPWRKGQENEVTSDAATRDLYSQSGLVPLLWDPAVRLHRAPAEGESPVSSDGLTVDAVELLRLDRRSRASLAAMAHGTQANGVAIVHGRLSAQLPPVELPKALRLAAELNPQHKGGARRLWMNGVLPAGVRIAEGERKAVHLALVTSAAELPQLDPGQPAEADVHGRWLYHMYLATQSVPDEAAVAALLTREYHVIGGIRVLFGPRGLVTVATRPEVIDPGRQESYYAGSSFRHRTGYADAFALAKLQDIAVSAAEAELLRLARSEPRRVDVARLERTVLVLQRVYLAAGFGDNRDAHAMLRRQYEEAGLAGRVQTLREDLGELSRQVQTSESEKTNAILGLIAAVGLPLGTGLAIWSGLPSAGADSLWRTLLPVGVVILVLVTAFPGLRRLVFDAVKRKGRRS
ncbi:hypothetical protein [Streptomyces sp. 184]|uniref:hypothetical protein n=1 Tax=Streptomyces sp. 184 TaxID=1827526 RepID=UPI0038913F36